jgi:ferredoxin
MAMAEDMPDNWLVEIEGGSVAFPCRSDQNLLAAMIGARQTSIKVGCRNGGCGVCRVQVTQGHYQSQKMTRSRISEAEEAKGIVLACRILPQSDIALLPLPLTPARISLI